MFAPEFAEQLAAQWGRGPHLFRNALRAPVFGAGDFMTAMTAAAREYVADPGARVPPARVYLRSEMAPPGHRAPFIPRRGEACEAYASRLALTFPDTPFGIVIDNCEKHLPALRESLTPVLHRLFASASYPARRNHLCIYAGNYRSTPFGIHRDDCHVVMCCGVGRKAMAFWPGSYFDDKPGVATATKVRAPVADYLADATVLEIGPLDVLYWSAIDWHVAVSETDAFQAALSVGIYHHGTSAELVAGLDFMAAATQQSGLDVKGLPVPDDGVLSVEALRQSALSGFFERWAALRERFSAAGEDDRRALDFALRIMSSAGFGRLRHALPVVPTDLDQSVVRCECRESLVCSHAAGGLMVGANGSAFLYAHDVAAVETLVRALREGQPLEVASLVAADPARADVVRRLLHDLVGAGAVSVSR